MATPTIIHLTFISKDIKLIKIYYVGLCNLIVDNILESLIIDGVNPRVAFKTIAI